MNGRDWWMVQTDANSESRGGYVGAVAMLARLIELGFPTFTRSQQNFVLTRSYSVDHLFIHMHPFKIHPLADSNGHGSWLGTTTSRARVPHPTCRVSKDKRRYFAPDLPHHHPKFTVSSQIPTYCNSIQYHCNLKVQAYGDNSCSIHATFTPSQSQPNPVQSSAIDFEGWSS